MDIALLKKLRGQNGLTQQQVADCLHMDRSTYAYYESGHTKPSVDTLVKLARLFQVSLYEFLGAPPAPAPAAAGPPAMRFSLLSKEEKKLVILFRACGSEQRQALVGDGFVQLE